MQFRLVLLMAVIAALAFAVTATALTPGEILSNYSSGMLKVVSDCSSGEYQGSGFLIGPRVMITAAHVMEDTDGSACSTTVTQEGTGVTASAARYTSWYTVSPGDGTDLAVVLLDRDLAGYYFVLSPTSPRVGDTLIGLGYPLGEPLSLAQGHVLGRGLTGGVAELAISILQTHGNSGGPLLNQSGYVVGLTQRGSQLDAGQGVTSSTLYSLDLARFLGGNISELCTGAAAGVPSTVCNGSQPVAPTSNAHTLSSCWASSTDDTSESGKLYATGDALPTLYFVAETARPMKKAQIATVTLTQPNGLPAWTQPVTWQWKKGARDYITGPTTWGSSTAIPGGLWTFTVSLADGSSCSYAFNVMR